MKLKKNNLVSEKAIDVETTSDRHKHPVFYCAWNGLYILPRGGIPICCRAVPREGIFGNILHSKSGVRSLFTRGNVEDESNRGWQCEYRSDHPCG